MWARFTADHDFRAGQTITAYKAGWAGNVTRACADEAVTAGRAKVLKTPRKGKEPEDGETTTSG